MAHYDVTCGCGHTETVQLFGKTAERERKIKWLEGRPCTACDIAARSAAGRAEGIEGSDKQVAWAHDIRARMLESIEAGRAYPEAKEALGAWVRSHGRARWYIDNRSVEGLDPIFRLMPDDERQALVQRVAAQVKERTVA